MPKGCPQDQIAHHVEKSRRERLLLAETLDVLNADHHISVVIHGAYKGADTLASDWARRRWVKELPFPANWKAEGKRAGPIRNQRMVAEGNPDLVVAFPGGDGTNDLITKAKAAGIKVIEVSFGLSE
jgi:hypothetical protein